MWILCKKIITMRKACILYSSILFLVYSCNQDKVKETPPILSEALDSARLKSLQITTSSELEIFRNIEIVDFCVLIPMNEYDEKFDDNEKAAHSFIHKTKKDNTISIQGLLRANSEVSIEEYFKNSLEDAELEGKIIEKKELIKESNCFYAKGYWNNSIYESRFIEVCWLRSDEVVKYYTSFDIADTTLWNNRLNEILNSGSTCK